VYGMKEAAWLSQ